ncbi:unnamed protein product [Protopolystoma xenopodis]|uniref:Uncharacterized protein n=1 Tax=Protopolystoma xenopodis TaxID=117903 RepID=A0A3S5CJV4_9PLAT|nr:unnamed protein product [Protopolystoma xenopodis]
MPSSTDTAMRSLDFALFTWEPPRMVTQDITRLLFLQLPAASPNFVHRPYSSPSRSAELAAFRSLHLPPLGSATSNSAKEATLDSSALKDAQESEKTADWLMELPVDEGKRDADTRFLTRGSELSEIMPLVLFETKEFPSFGIVLVRIIVITCLRQV